MSERAPSHPTLGANATLRWPIVRAHLDALQPKTILEMGVGMGAVGANLAERGDYVGVEPDETSRAVASSRIGDAGRVVASLDELDDDRSFDLGCAFEVLEHIADDAGALTEWVQRVEPGGHFLVSVPADPHRFGPWDELAGHLRRYTKTDLAKLFEAAGLQVVDVQYYGYPLGVILEAGRDQIARRRLARPSTPGDADGRTAQSARALQPPRWARYGIWYATAPFRVLQRRFPDRGIGLVGLASKPR
jgi:SAM-dependent methyltransferase